MARAFVELQQLRHQADHEMRMPPSVDDVRAGITLAEQAIARWRTLKVASPALANVVLVSLMHPSPR